MNAILKIDTKKSLLFTFNMKTVVPLYEVCAELYPELKKPAIMKLARTNGFGFPVFRGYDSQKAPYMVDINDLAKYLDEEAEKARHDFKNAKIA